jgi:two-component system sensor histidine kinase UhpB
MRSVWQSVVNPGLWLRTAFTISIGFLALFIAFTLLGEWALHDSTNRLLDERLVVAQMAANEIDAVLERVALELEQANHFAMFGDAGASITSEAEFLARAYRWVGDFAPGITLIDRAGRVILAHPSDLYTSGDDLSMLPHISQALAARVPTISDGFIAPGSHYPVVAVTVPVYQNDQFWGLLSGLLDLSSPAVIEILRQAATAGHTGHAALVDAQGRTLASTFELDFLSPGEHFTFYQQAINTGKPVIETVPFERGDILNETEDHLHVMAFAPLKNAPWGVAVGGDEAETFAGVGRLRLGLALLGGAALAGVWGITLLGTRQIVRPMQYLTQAARQLAHGDLHTPLRSVGTGEVGAMAVALEQMRRQLLSSIEELANWNETLETSVTQQTRELHQQQRYTRHLLRRTITAQEEERARLAREMHDGIGQSLTAVKMSLDRLAKGGAAQPDEAGERLAWARELMDLTIADLRQVIMALRPGILDQLGLVPALHWMGDRTLRPQGILMTAEIEGLHERLPENLETVLFRIAQEAMNNTARHSHARHLVLRLLRQNGAIVMALADDGCGCGLGTVSSIPDQEGSGFGLASMRERALLAGGQFTVKSAPGQGAEVTVTLPVNSPNNE